MGSRPKLEILACLGFTPGHTPESPIGTIATGERQEKLGRNYASIYTVLRSDVVFGRKVGG